MPNLFPDMSRENYEGSEDFIFGAPIQEADWRLLYQNAMKSKNGVRFYTDRPSKITILLRESHHSDDDMLEAGAWLRMLLGDKNRMYAVESFREMSLTNRMLKTIGAPRHLSVMYDLPKLGDDKNES